MKWEHIVSLYDYQKTNGFKLANKLTKQHVHFDKNKMKVKYASQVISQSVANSLLTMHDMKIEKFEDVHGTVEYLKCFDEIFDAMNSKTLNERFLKSPLKKSNEENWKSLFQRSICYITHLRT